jgi:hypothetical protein
MYLINIFSFLDYFQYEKLIEKLVKKHLESDEIESDKLATPLSLIESPL